MKEMWQVLEKLQYSNVLALSESIGYTSILLNWNSARLTIFTSKFYRFSAGLTKSGPDMIEGAVVRMYIKIICNKSNERKKG